MRKLMGAVGLLLLFAGAFLQSASADSFLIDGSSLPPDTDSTRGNTNTGTGSHATVIGEWDWFYEQGTVNNPQTPDQSNTNPNNPGQAIVSGATYTPLGAGNKGIQLDSNGTNHANGNNKMTYDFKLSNATSTGATFAARFMVLRTNNNLPAYTGHTGTGSLNGPSSAILSMQASGGPGIAVGITGDDGFASDTNYQYSLASFRPNTPGNPLQWIAPRFAPLDSSTGTAFNTSQRSNGWVDVWLYTDNTGSVIMRFLDEATGNVVNYSSTLQLSPGTGDAAFSAGSNEMPVPGNGAMKVLFDVVRLDQGNTVGTALVPEPSSFLLATCGVFGLVGYRWRKRCRN